MELRDKVVLITGASGGIGAACAEAFRGRGARLSLVARSLDKLERIGGGQAAVTGGDLCDAAVRRRAVDATLERFGRIDVLVNNAGVGLYTPAWRAPMPEVRAMFELNLFAALEMIQLVAPVMQRQGGGTVVNISSIGGRVTLPWLTLYSASKFALCSLTDGLRMELGQSGIRCMAVCPGYVKTGFQDNALLGRPPDKLWRRRQFAITPEKCAEAVVRGVERGKRTVVTPGMGRLLMAGRALMPGVIDHFLERIYRDLDLV